MPTEPKEEAGPVQLPKGAIINRWKILGKLGEGGCGAVYKVASIERPGEVAALKAESNFVSGGSVLKLEVQILRRLEGRLHVAQLLVSGKKQSFCYMVMTLLGDSLNNIMKKINNMATVSTQVRIGINTLYGIKQVHDIGFIHRDLKPANIAVGKKGSGEARFLHILDFGLAREYVMRDNGILKMRRPRQRALFRGTTRYCSVATHERREQGRVDDLWSLLYMMSEFRQDLPWSNGSSKDEIMQIKKDTEPHTMLANSPVQLIEFSNHLSTLNYYSRPNYELLFSLLSSVMEIGGYKWTDLWDWEKKGLSSTLNGMLSREKSMEVVTQPSKETIASAQPSAEGVTMPLVVPHPATGQATPRTKEFEWDPTNPFPVECFKTNPIGF